MRDEGEGIVRVFREMADSFLREPEMTSESGLFTITLFNEAGLAGLRSRLEPLRRPASSDG